MAAKKDLHLNEDLPFQRRQWAFERIGWAFLALILLAGAAGAFGDGPLSRKQAGEGNLQVDYERFVRHDKPTDIDMTVTPGNSGEVRVSVTREFLLAVQMEQVTPEPEHVEAGGDALTYVFVAPSSATSIEVTFTFRPDELGSHEATVRAGEGQAVTLKQFTYP
jgi:hypothetical protein